VLKGLGDLAKMGSVLKQAMEVKDKIEGMKESLGNERVEAMSGGGMVRVVMSGKFELLQIKIDPEVIDRNEPEMLETLVQAAVNDGVNKISMLIKQRMSELTGGLDIPGLT
jgi:DNA-binding YbaB/EbfC family protein